jgi:hypothetical protein
MLATCFTLISCLTDVSDEYIASIFTVVSRLGLFDPEDGGEIFLQNDG